MTNKYMNCKWLLLPKQLSAKYAFKYELHVMMYIFVQLMKTGISLNVFVRYCSKTGAKTCKD
jgi:hypothetical protein